MILKLIQAILKSTFYLWVSISLSGCAGVILASATAGINTVKIEQKKTKIEKKLKQKNTIKTGIEKETTNKQTFIKIPVKKLKPNKVSSIEQKKFKSQKIPNLKTLNGIGSKHLKNILGNPNFIRRDGLAEIWLYQQDKCKLHIFLYKSASNRNLLVSHLETNILENSIFSETQCINEIIKSSKHNTKVFPSS